MASVRCAHTGSSASSRARPRSAHWPSTGTCSTVASRAEQWSPVGWRRRGHRGASAEPARRGRRGRRRRARPPSSQLRSRAGSRANTASTRPARNCSCSEPGRRPHRATASARSPRSPSSGVRTRVAAPSSTSLGTPGRTRSAERARAARSAVNRPRPVGGSCDARRSRSRSTRSSSSPRSTR